MSKSLHIIDHQILATWTEDEVPTGIINPIMGHMWDPDEAAAFSSVVGLQELKLSQSQAIKAHK